MKTPLHALVLSLLLAVPSAAGEGLPWLPDWDAASKAAAAAGRPVLVDFQAVWCYACYYMDRNVFAKPEFAAASKGFVLLRVDADTAEGRALKERFGVRFLPTVVVADAKGRELGRIVGEEEAPAFLSRLSRIAGGAPAEDLSRLTAYVDAGEAEKARGERDRLLKTAAARDPVFQRFSLRTDLTLAKEAKKPEEAAKAFDGLLAVEDDCRLASDAEEAFDATEGLDAAKRRPLLEKAVARLAAIAERRVFVERARRCAGLRSMVYMMSALQEELGGKEKGAAVFVRAAGLLRADADKAGYGSDRNLEDNLRFFLENAKRDAELDDLYPRLIAAYPSDYVYPFRYGKNLLGRKEYARALPFAEKGYALSYGANRIPAAESKARVLAGLGRKTEALALLESELKVVRARFPSKAADFEKVLKELR
ncbi:MAG: thioredoxin family protein [Elusimicrobiota bacterium]|jgi:thioredoxin-like negative regulator of GroEL